MSYDESGRPFMITYANVSYYYLLNAQGDVVGIMNVSGDIMVEYTYDAWGNVLSITGPMADTMGQHNQLRYRGYVYDPETNLYFLNSRFYNPETGRFLNADAYASTGQGVLGSNMFAYCGNNPIVSIDATGTFLTKVCFDAFNPFDFTPIFYRGGSSGGSGTTSGNAETTAYGIYATASLGISVYVALAVTFDEEGNVGFMATLAIGAGTPSAGLGVFKSSSNAPNIKDLRGHAFNIGTSGSVGNVSAGIEHNVSFEKNTFQYHGQTTSAGLSVGLPMEFHYTIGFTWVWEIYNASNNPLKILWDLFD